MGYAAAIGSLVEAGVSIYGDLSKKGPNLGEYSSTLNDLANKYVTPYANNPGFWNLDVPGMAQQSIQFGMQNAPAINQFDMSQLQGLLNQALPGYQGMVNQMATNTSSLLQGQVPADVANQIQRQMAQQTLTSGIGGGGGAMGTSLGAGLTTNAATARSLGLTSLGLQQQGATELQNLLGMTSNYLMPQMVNPLSLLPTSELLGAKQWSDTAQYQASLAAYNAKANAAAARVGAPISQAAGLAGSIQALTQNLSSTNPSTGQSGFSSLLGMFGGGGGGGGGQAGTAGAGGNYMSNTGYFIGSSPGAGQSGFASSFGG